MSPESLDLWRMLFFAGAGLLIFIQACRGWRLGLIRQLLELAAIAGAYSSAYFVGPRIAPLFRPLELPYPVVKAVADSIAGFLVYLTIRMFGAIVFKRTDQQGVGLIRFGFGLGGAAVGGLFGLFIVWVLTFAIRLCGSLAESKVRMSDAAQGSGHAIYKASAPTEPAWLRGLVHLKEAMEQGPTGDLVKQVDPLPQVLYSTMGRIGAMLSSEQSVERFLSYPGIQPLADHPKIVALRNDPLIIRDVMSANYLGLLHNPRLVQATNDQEILALLRGLDVQKALDYALSRPQGPSKLPVPR